MREDDRTTDLRGAERWQAHHADEGLPASFGIHAADVAFRMAGDDDHEPWVARWTR